MSLEDMLKNVSGITNRVIKENCWEGQFNVLEGIQVLQSKINEIILAINNGIIKGDKGDTPNVQVGSTETLEPGNNASVTQTGDILNPILNFSIPKGDKGDKGDTGKASESIQDNIVGLDTCWSSQKTVGYVDNMFNSLQDVKGVKYTTDKDYFVASGSKNGVVKDLTLKGKTLVNILDRNRTPFKAGGTNAITVDNDKVTLENPTGYTFARFYMNKGFEKGKLYTFVVNVLECTSNSYGIFIENASGSTMNSGQVILKTGINIFKLTVTTEDSINMRFFVGENQTSKCSISRDILILEGDHTQNPPSYFEGIASVGNGNKIEVLSRKEDGNLFDGELLDGLYDTSTGVFTPNSDVKCNKNKIAIFANRKIKLSQPLTGGSYRVFYYNSKRDYLESQLITSPYTFTPNVDARYINFQIAKSHYKDGIALNYEVFNGFEYKQDRKTILFKDEDSQWKPITELRGINLNICDNIENGVFNKLLSLETVSDKNTFTLRSQDGGTLTNCFEVNEPLTNCNVSDTNFIGLCDKFKTYNWTGVNGLVSSDVEGVTILSNKKIRFRILKSKANSVEELKSYLINNNFNILRLLENKLTYEVNPLDLQSFENETMILFNYGLVNGSSEFYIDSNLGSITLENMVRLSRIENEIYQVKKVVLNGDFRTLAQSTYPEDFKEVLKYE